MKENVTGVCSFCAGAFGATEGAKAAGATFISEYDGHPSFGKLVAEGFQIITF